MSQCNICGRELNEDEVCSCMQPSASGETSTSIEPNPAPARSQNPSTKGIIPAIIGFFARPAASVKDAAREGNWKHGLIFILIYVLVVGLIGTYNYISSSLKGYDEDIKTAKKAYNEYKEKYEKASDDDYMKDSYKASMENAESALDDAKEEKADLLKSGDYYKGVFKNLWLQVLNPLLSIVLLISALFVAAKVFNGNGSFTSIIAGVGMAANIYLLSALVLPLLAKIPKLDFFSLIIPVVAYIFALLVYIAFNEVFKFSQDKAVFSVFIAFAISALICGLILKNNLLPVNSPAVEELNPILEIFK